MALTDAQVVSVRRYLGWSLRSPDDELSRMLVGLSAAAEAVIIDIITKIAAIDSAINTAATSASRIGIQRVEEVVFFGAGSSFDAQATNRGQLVQDLSNLLGVPVKNAGGGGAMNFAN